MRLNILLIVIYCFIFNNAYGQAKNKTDFSVMANYHYGVLLPEYQMVNYLANDYIRALDLSIYKKSTGKNFWEQLYNYPEYGFSLYYTTLGNNSIFGKEIALNYFFKLFIISKKRFQLYNRTGIGLSYVSEKYNSVENYMNVAIGSHANIHFNIRLGASYLITKKYKLNMGISFDHLSNANTSEPNLGLNSITTYTGICYYFGNPPKLVNNIIAKFKPENYFEVFANVGGKHTRALSSNYYPTFSTAFEYHRSVFPAIHFGTGIDLFYDGSIYEQFKNIESDYKNSYGYQSGIHISQTFVYNRLKIELQEGIYILLPEKIANNKIYTKVILKYYITPKINVRLLMKSYLHILNYPEIGVGYKF
ncbi:MAG: acyloxyacyl hydrolase [Salinivirgaceae bacterium]|nr:acyloxyacyl hydrolase [Salinivirgaceae bacterium]